MASPLNCFWQLETFGFYNYFTKLLIFSPYCWTPGHSDENKLRSNSPVQKCVIKWKPHNKFNLKICYLLISFNDVRPKKKVVTSRTRKKEAESVMTSRELQFPADGIFVIVVVVVVDDDVISYERSEREEEERN